MIRESNADQHRIRKLIRRVAAERVVLRTAVGDAVPLVGAVGDSNEMPTYREFRDAEALQIAEGTNQTQ